jgi:hypothetical protein
MRENFSQRFLQWGVNFLAQKIKQLVKMVGRSECHLLEKEGIECFLIGLFSKVQHFWRLNTTQLIERFERPNPKKNVKPYRTL